MTHEGGKNSPGNNDKLTEIEKIALIDKTRDNLLKLKGQVPNSNLIELEKSLKGMDVAGLRQLSSEVGANGQRESVAQAKWMNGLMTKTNTGSDNETDSILSNLKLNS